MNANPNYDADEIKYMIETLCGKTQKGAVIWKCEEYLPASFLLGSKYGEGDERKSSVSQSATFVCAPPGFKFVLEVFESITVSKNPVGIISPKLEAYDPDANMMFSKEVIIETADSDEFGLLPLSDAVFERADEWLEDEYFMYMDDRYFYPETGVTKKHKLQPLCRIMESLMRNRNVNDFHKMILNAQFRAQLLSELG
jgi:hypothetical protein